MFNLLVLLGQQIFHPTSCGSVIVAGLVVFGALFLIKPETVEITINAILLFIEQSMNIITLVIGVFS